MNDVFYSLKSPTVKRAKDILIWGNSNGLRTDVDMLKHIRRERADRSFEEVLSLVDKSAVGFFRVVYRPQRSMYLILSEEKDIRDSVELFIRNINIDQTEYFIFIYLSSDKLDYLKNTYELEQLV
jgi:hypothetical protein